MTSTVEPPKLTMKSIEHRISQIGAMQMLNAQVVTSQDEPDSDLLQELG